MEKYINIVKKLIKYDIEEEWFEFKTNQTEPYAVGEYISALSNAAAFHNGDFAYLVWGIHDQSHEIIGTKFNFRQNIHKEPFEHFLARQITPDILFSFHEIKIENKRVVVLEIPAASKIPTSFDMKRYLRIGSIVKLI
ncbi:MAG: helix-turn-helix domain-containing protein [Bdellovibrionota bacterium]